MKIFSLLMLLTMLSVNSYAQELFCCIKSAQENKNEPQKKYDNQYCVSPGWDEMKESGDAKGVFTAVKFGYLFVANTNLFSQEEVPAITATRTDGRPREKVDGFFTKDNVDNKNRQAQFFTKDAMAFNITCDQITKY